MSSEQGVVGRVVAEASEAIGLRATPPRLPAMTERRDHAPGAASGDEELVHPLDPSDPRFPDPSRRGAEEHPRRLVASQGPGSSRLDPNVRRLRVAIPVVSLLILVGVVTVFFVGLDPGDGQQIVGPVEAVRAAVEERPHRVCYGGSLPCAWIAPVDDELVAFNTSGPLNEEYGRLGVAWCPTSGRYGANATGSRYDSHGTVVDGPAPRGLDRFALATTPDGRLRIDFFTLTAGQQVAIADPAVPATGPECEQIAFDRDADLVLEGAG